MKKLIGIITLILISCCALMAQQLITGQENTLSTENTTVVTGDQQYLSSSKIEHLLKNNLLFEKENEITKLSQNLTSVQKDYIYDNYKKGSFVPFGINYLVGFGIGSFIQGDTKTGMIAAGGELISIGVLLCSYCYIFTEALNYNPNFNYEEDIFSLGSNAPTITYIAIASLVSYWGLRCFEIITPFFYTKKYNNKLRNILDENDTNLSMSLVPSLNSDGNPAVAGAFTVKL